MAPKSPGVHVSIQRYIFTEADVIAIIRWHQLYFGHKVGKRRAIQAYLDEALSNQIIAVDDTLAQHQEEDQ